MEVAEVLQRVQYKKIVTGELVDLCEMYIWTPDGGYTAKLLIDPEKMPGNTTYLDIVIQARQREPAQRPVISGEWHQARKILQKTEPEVEKKMITGFIERTGTVLDYSHGRKKKKKNWYDGHVIQLPEVDEDGNFIRDEKGMLVARDIFEMALPTKSDYVKNYPPELNPFFNAIYGEEDVMQQLPDHARFLGGCRDGERNVVCGGVDLFKNNNGPTRRRFNVDGGWQMLYSNNHVTSRVTAEMSE